MSLEIFIILPRWCSGYVVHSRQAVHSRTVRSKRLERTERKRERERERERERIANDGWKWLCRYYLRHLSKALLDVLEDSQQQPLPGGYFPQSNSVCLVQCTERVLTSFFRRRRRRRKRGVFYLFSSSSSSFSRKRMVKDAFSTLPISRGGREREKKLLTRSIEKRRRRRENIRIFVDCATVWRTSTHARRRRFQGSSLSLPHSFSFSPASLPL